MATAAPRPCSRPPSAATPAFSCGRWRWPGSRSWHSWRAEVSSFCCATWSCWCSARKGSGVGSQFRDHYGRFQRVTLVAKLTPDPVPKEPFAGSLRICILPLLWRDGFSRVTGVDQDEHSTRRKFMARTRIPLNAAEGRAQSLAGRLDLSTAEIGLTVRTTNCLE